MKIFFSRFVDVMVTVHPAVDRDDYLVCEWTWLGDGWEQSAPTRVESLPVAMALKPPAAKLIKTNKSFAAGGWTYTKEVDVANASPA